MEPTVIYEGGTWKMWYTGNDLAAHYAVGYATCTGDPTNGAIWTKYAGNPVLGQGGSGIGGDASRNFVFKDGSTYHIYYGDGTDLHHATSSDGITWGSATTVITAASVGGGATQMTNSAVWKEGTNDWRMLPPAGHSRSPLNGAIGSTGASALDSPASEAWSRCCATALYRWVRPP
jgi:hypothetical protein